MVFLSKRYWNRRYKSGGNSGLGSVGEKRLWKWSIIDKYVNISDCKVLDIGCGDLSFWDDKRAKEYLGFDFSSVVIDKNRQKFPELEFKQVDISKQMTNTAEVVFCFELLFHVMKEKEYKLILKNLSKATERLLFLTSWLYCHLDKVSDGKYVYFRDLDKHLSYIELELVDRMLYKGDGQTLMYIFRRNEQ